MNESAKLSLIWAVAIVCAIASIAFALSHYHTTVTVEAMKCGYSQQSLPGTHGVYWVKDDKLEGERK